MAPAGLGERVDLVLLVFGLAAIVGIWITGVFVDRWLRPLILASSLIFAGASLALGLAGRDPAVVFISVAAWGIAFGGCATLFQTALAIAAGDAADVAQSLLVVTWNSAISGGGIIGGSYTWERRDVNRGNVWQVIDGDGMNSLGMPQDGREVLTRENKVWG